MIITKIDNKSDITASPVKKYSVFGMYRPLDALNIPETMKGNIAVPRLRADVMIPYAKPKGEISFG